MKKLLLLNANLNLENSRTYYLTKKVIEKYELDKQYEIKELNLYDLNLPYLNEELLNRRSELILQRKFDVEEFNLAREVRDADFILVSAPMFDMSYPAVLKVFIENVSISNLLFTYDGNEIKGLCKASKLLYVTTRGWNIKNRDDLGYKNMVQVANMWGIKDTKLIGVSKTDLAKRPFRDIDDFVSKLGSLDEE